MNKWKLATSPFVLLVFADIAKKVIRSEKEAHRRNTKRTRVMFSAAETTGALS